MNPEDVPTVALRRLPPAQGAEAGRAASVSGHRAGPPQVWAGEGGDPFPAVGEVLDQCRIVAELGRGASGRAYLARQEPLADRPLVLKVTRTTARHEELNLARLQHTNIMPLYWASTLAERGLRVLAMPYLARTTLADLLDRLSGGPVATWTGRRAFEVLEREQAQMPVQIAVQPHTVQTLKESSWVEFVVRVGRAVAEALAYAHDRGLLHLDLKPSNILIAPDGQPILLDLDVARQPIAAGVTVVPWLGGTWSFMSPEQRAAIGALTDGQPVPVAVDQRSDLYSLGLVLYRALGGADGPPEPLGLPRRNPRVSRGLAAILARCLAENPADRYPDGSALADDLRRHLHDLPLRGVRTPLSERWGKWRRRRPLGLPLLLLAVGFCAAAGATGFTLHQRNDERRQQAEAALHDGRERQRLGQHEAAIDRFLTGRELAERTYGTEPLRAELGRRLSQAQRLQRAEELNKVVGAMRFYALQDHTPRRLQWVLEAGGRRLWANRALLTDRSAGSLEQAAESDIREQLQELVLLWADLYVRIAPPAKTDAVRAEVRKVLAEAEELFGPSLALSLAREQLGEAPGARPEPRATWEFCTLARHSLGRGDTAAASRYSQAALDREPLGFVPNFYFGVCALRQARYEAAARTFSFCLGQNPCAECFLLRGQALAALGESERALRDFDHALERNPELGAAYQCRGDVYRALGRAAAAEADLKRAHQLSD